MSGQEPLFPGTTWGASGAQASPHAGQLDQYGNSEDLYARTTGQAPPPPSGGPSRRVVLLSLLAAAATAVVAGTAYGVLHSSPPPAAPTAGQTNAAAPTTSASPASKPSPSLSASQVSPSASPLTPPAKIEFQDKPWALSLDFGILMSIKRNGDSAVITVDRATFYTDKAATAYYKAHKDLEPLDYAIENTNKRLRTFTVDPDAELFAQFALNDPQRVATSTLTINQLVTRAKAALANGDQLLVWLRHTGPDGPVNYLAEQFVP